MMHARQPRQIASGKLLAALLIGALLAASLGAVETLSQRRRRVEAMSAEQREELFRSEQEFRKLPPEEQQRIRELHDQIESAPDREKLLATMNRYCKWFETQQPFRRAKLLDKKKPLDDRIATVKEFLAKQGPSKDIHLDDTESPRSGRLAGPLHHGARASIHREDDPGQPRIRQASAGSATSGRPRESLAALAGGRAEWAIAHRGARNDSARERAFAGAAQEAGGARSPASRPGSSPTGSATRRPINSTGIGRFLREAR